MVPLSFRERQSLIKEMSEQYRSANKRDKNLLIDQLQALTDFNRSYAARALRTIKPPVKKQKRSSAGRKRYYESAILHDLKYIWAILDFPAGKRLAPFLSKIVPIMENNDEIELLPEVLAKLIKIISATIDPILASERKKTKNQGVFRN